MMIYGRWDGSVGAHGSGEEAVTMKESHRSAALIVLLINSVQKTSRQSAERREAVRAVITLCKVSAEDCPR